MLRERGKNGTSTSFTYRLTRCTAWLAAVRLGSFLLEGGLKVVAAECSRVDVEDFSGNVTTPVGMAVRGSTIVRESTSRVELRHAGGDFGFGEPAVLSWDRQSPGRFQVIDQLDVTRR